MDSIVFYSILFCSFSPEQLQGSISEVKQPQSHLTCVYEAENLDIQADELVGFILEQLKAEEKTIRQERKKAPDGDTVQEVDPKEAVDEGTATQENVLNQEKKSEVSWVKNNGYFRGQRQFYSSGSYDGFLKFVRHFHGSWVISFCLF